jgi:trimeric autotransporter adhesin
VRIQAGGRTGSLSRGVPALAVMAAVAVTVAGGATAAATVPGHAAPAHQAGLSAAGVISTVAGGAGGPAKATKVALGNRFNNAGVCGVWFARGSLYVADGYAVRKVNPQTDRLTTPAGTNSPGRLSPRGLATRASLTTCGVTLDAAGNLVIIDIEHRRVAIVAAATGRFYGQAMTKGHIYSVAGGGKNLGDGVPATSASLAPNDAEVAVDAAGNVLINDGSRVRTVAARTGTFYGQAMTAGDIYTIAGNGIIGFAGDGGPATSAELSQPQGLALDTAGNVLIGDTGNNRVRVVAESTGTQYGQAMTVGDIYTIAGNGTAGFAGDGGPATSAELGDVQGRGLPLAVDTAGNLLIADTDNNRVRVVAESTGTHYGQAMTAGDIYTIAGGGTNGLGDGGPATEAELSNPRGITVDATGNVLIADWLNGRVREVAARTGTSYGRPVTAGDIYTIAGNGTIAYSGDRGIATRAQLNFPQGAASDGAGNLLIADTDNERIRAVAVSTGTFYGRAMTTGDIYTIAGNGTQGASGNGGLAARAELSGPEGVALDTAGNLLIADTGNNSIRVVSESTGTFFGRTMTAGHIYTIASASGLRSPSGVAADSHGNAVIADTDSHRVRVVAGTTGTFYGQAMTAGKIYTIAGTGQRGFSGDGGPATSAELSFPSGAASDSAGNLLIADTGNNRVRVVAESTGTFYGQAMTAGNIYTIAGNGTGGFAGDGGPATSAEFNGPQDAASDSAGNLLIADIFNERIRVVAARTGTFYGQAMTAGDIYTIVGSGTQGFSGDGGPATGAGFDFPRMAFAAAGNLFIVDELNNRIRMVTVSASAPAPSASAPAPLSPPSAPQGHRSAAPR